MINLIGVSGKIGTGKDTVGKMIQHLTSLNSHIPFEKYVGSEYDNEDFCDLKIKQFADPIKDIVCILTGCTRAQLEDRAFKESKLPNEWIRYGYADGFIKEYIGDGAMGKPIMKHKQCSKEKYEAERTINWQTAYKDHLTYRQLLQYIGTDLFRKQVHEDTWVNALMSKYVGTIPYLSLDDRDTMECIPPNWIITDVRFPNEAAAIKKRGGIVIQLLRNVESIGNHESETALDDYQHFDLVMFNNKSLSVLLSDVENMLNLFKIHTNG